MIYQDIYSEVINSFGALWQYKERNHTLEIITPYCTTNNKFISVFLTHRDNFYIISDGGWIEQNIYENIDRDDDIYYQKIFFYYENYFNINSVESNNIKYFFKKTENKLLVPNLVFDVANFITAIISSSMIQLKDEREEREKERFATKVDTLLQVISPNKEIRFNKSIDDTSKSVKFNAIIPYGTNFTLINYVTGTTPYYYKNNLARANTNFQIANEKYAERIKDEISIIDDDTAGYNITTLSPYIEALLHTTKKPPVKWSERDKLVI